MGQGGLHLRGQFRHSFRLLYRAQSPLFRLHFRNSGDASLTGTQILHLLPWRLSHVPHRLLLLRQLRSPLLNQHRA